MRPIKSFFFPILLRHIRNVYTSGTKISNVHVWLNVPRIYFALYTILDAARTLQFLTMQIESRYRAKFLRAKINNLIENVGEIHIF